MEEIHCIEYVHCANCFQLLMGWDCWKHNGVFYCDELCKEQFAHNMQENDE